MSPATLEALRAADAHEFIEAFSDAMRTQRLSRDDLAVFINELHRRADKKRAALAARDARRSAEIALAEAPAPSTAKN